MSKKGFTLIEVVTVIFIIGMLFLIAVPPITKLIKDSKADLYEKQLTNIQLAASNWVSDNLGIIYGDTEIEITLRDLKDGGYIDEDVANPKTGKPFSDEMIIIIKPGTGKEVSYEIKDDTIKDNQDDSNYPSILLIGKKIEYVEINTPYQETKSVKVIDNNGNEVSTSIEVAYKKKINNIYEDVETIDSSSLSQYQVVYSATVDGKTVNTIKNVIVRDTIKPEIMVNGKTTNQKIIVDLNQSYTIPTATATDNSNESINVDVTGTVDTSKVGNYQIVYSASDSSGNEAKLVLSVEVTEKLSCQIEVLPDTATRQAELKIVPSNSFVKEYAFEEEEFSDNNVKKISQNGTYKAKVKDIRGRIADCEITVRNIDNESPVITFDPTSDNVCHNSSYNVTLTATDDIEVTSLLYCQTTGNNSSCTPTTTANPTGTSISIDTDSNYHVICAQATDRVGNITTECSNEEGNYYSLDTTGPEISNNITPTTADGSNGWYKTLPVVNITGTDLGCGTYTGYKYQTSIDGGAYSTLSALQTNDNSLNSVIASNECKTIQYKVTGYDGNNNSSSTYTSNSFKYDKTAPVITVDGHTSDYSVEYEPVSMYEDGTAVYYNPETGQICDDYVEANSLNENKSGCMKWYIFNDDTSKDTVDMILDHNTTYGVVWNSSGDNSSGPNEILTQLQSDTSSWSDSLIRSDSYTDPLNGYTIDYSGYRARLIEANEIAKITGADTALQWDSGKPYGTTIGTQSSYYYLDGAYGTDSVWQTKVATSIGASHYAWLFNYTSGCTSYGCNTADSGTNGYWTSSASAVGSYGAWDVGGGGYVSGNSVFLSSSYGLRPVITIDKSILNIEPTSEYEIPTGTATDNCGGSTSVTTSGSVNTSVPGNYPIVYTSTDLAGNTETLTLTLKVKDITPPVITVDGHTSDYSIEITKGIESFTLPTGTAIDDSGETIDVITSGIVNTSLVGNYEVKYTATDSSGNSTTLILTVNVIQVYANQLEYSNSTYTTCSESQCALDELYGKLTGNVVDKVNPQISFDPIPDDSYHSSNYNVTLTATGDIEVTSLLYCQTTGNNSSCTPTIVADPAGTSISINTDSDYHVICAQATDSAGNITTKCSNDGGKYYKLDKTS